MVRNALFAVASLILVGLAGCVGSDDASETLAAPDSSSFAFGEQDPNAGAIEGLIVDDEGRPVASASVGILELEVQVLSNAEGAFAFQNVPAGRYKVAAGALGFESAASSVLVNPSETARITITLTSITLIDAWTSTHGPLVGFLECGFGTPFWTDTCISTDFFGNLSGGRHRTYFQMDSQDWQSFVVDVWWQQTSAATGRGMQAFLRTDSSSGSHWYCARDGVSPLWMRYENPDNKIDSDCGGQGGQDPLPSPELTMTVEGYPGFAGLSTDNPPVRLTFQQRFEALVTVFYGDPAPADFSARPDQ